MNVERLEQLRRVVRDAPADRFDMNVVTDWKPCGTIHCAFGWALEDRWFLANTEIDETPFWHIPGIFDLGCDDVANLFDPPDTGAARPSIKDEVIANIDRILAGQPAVPYPDSVEGE